MGKEGAEEEDNHCRLIIADIDFCVCFRDPEISVFVGGRKQGKKKGGNTFGLSILDTGFCGQSGLPCSYCCVWNMYGCESWTVKKAER